MAVAMAVVSGGAQSHLYRLVGVPAIATAAPTRDRHRGDLRYTSPLCEVHDGDGRHPL